MLRLVSTIASPLVGIRTIPLLEYAMRFLLFLLAVGSSTATSDSSNICTRMFPLISRDCDRSKELWRLAAGSPVPYPSTTDRLNKLHYMLVFELDIFSQMTDEGANCDAVYANRAAGRIAAGYGRVAQSCTALTPNRVLEAITAEAHSRKAEWSALHVAGPGVGLPYGSVEWLALRRVQRDSQVELLETRAAANALLRKSNLPAAVKLALRRLVDVSKSPIITHELIAETERVARSELATIADIIDAAALAVHEEATAIHTQLVRVQGSATSAAGSKGQSLIKSLDVQRSKWGVIVLRARQLRFIAEMQNFLMSDKPVVRIHGMLAMITNDLTRIRPLIPLVTQVFGNSSAAADSIHLNMSVLTTVLEYELAQLSTMAAAGEERIDSVYLDRVAARLAFVFSDLNKTCTRLVGNDTPGGSVVELLIVIADSRQEAWAAMQSAESTVPDLSISFGSPEWATISRAVRAIRAEFVDSQALVSRWATRIPSSDARVSPAIQSALDVLVSVSGTPMVTDKVVLAIDDPRVLRYASTDVVIFGTLARLTAQSIEFGDGFSGLSAVCSGSGENRGWIGALTTAAQARSEKWDLLHTQAELIRLIVQLTLDATATRVDTPPQHRSDSRVVSATTTPTTEVPVAPEYGCLDDVDGGVEGSNHLEPDQLIGNNSNRCMWSNCHPEFRIPRKRRGTTCKSKV